MLSSLIIRMAAISVRPAESRDIPFIAQSQLDMALETEGRRLNAETVTLGVTAVLDDPAKGQYLVSEFEGQLIGSLLITYEWSDWRNGRFYWIQSAFVVREHRQQGAFKAMYRYVEELGRTQGCGVRLYVHNQNEAGKRTYERLGMRLTEYMVYEKDFVYPDGH